MASSWLNLMLELALPKTTAPASRVPLGPMLPMISVPVPTLPRCRVRVPPTVTVAPVRMPSVPSPVLPTMNWSPGARLGGDTFRLAPAPSMRICPPVTVSPTLSRVAVTLPLINMDPALLVAGVVPTRSVPADRVPPAWTTTWPSPSTCSVPTWPAPVTSTCWFVGTLATLAAVGVPPLQLAASFQSWVPAAEKSLVAWAWPACGAMARPANASAKPSGLRGKCRQEFMRASFGVWVQAVPVNGTQRRLPCQRTSRSRLQTQLMI